MTIYTDFSETALALLEEFGQSGTLKKVDLIGDEIDAPNGGSSVPSEYTVNIVVFPVNEMRIDGTNIRHGDYQVLMGAFGEEAVAGDWVICSEGTLSIIDPGKIAPDGTIVLYDMIARGK